VRPLAPYGQAKLDAEALVEAWSHRTGTPSLVGRIANLYGPGQNLAKAQGLISQICRSHLTGQPLSIYVSLDTLRDYLFAPDCAALIVEGLARLRQEQSGTAPMVVTKILASQRAITIGAVLGEMRRIFKSWPRIVLGGPQSPVPGLARARPPRTHPVPGGCRDHSGGSVAPAAGRGCRGDVTSLTTY
jgi:UDP-glucose 4-epimerase